MTITKTIMKMLDIVKLETNKMKACRGWPLNESETFATTYFAVMMKPKSYVELHVKSYTCAQMTPEMPKSIHYYPPIQ